MDRAAGHVKRYALSTALERVNASCHLFSDFFVSRRHFWFATVQEVLHADWQEAWHSPQPAATARFAELVLLRVFTFFITIPS
jgi:hypothetical protein